MKYCNCNIRSGFTLAEVLITLGVIGVVAALTLPTLVQNYQKKVLQVQFKKFYSTFYNAIRYVQAANGAPMGCYYWESSSNPYASNPAKCVDRNDYGSCKKWTASDGSPLPSNYIGDISECAKFGEGLLKALNIVKFCERQALANGCLTKNHRGLDKVKKEMYPDSEFDPNTTFSDAPIKNIYSSFVTADGTIYVKYYRMSDNPLYWVDINGTKGPNKYGYDIFIFKIIGNSINGITKITPEYGTVESGGSSFNDMLRK